MNRNDVTVHEWQAAPLAAVETAPVRDLNEVLHDIRVDALANAPKYLTETEVPYGGE